MLRKLVLVAVAVFTAESVDGLQMVAGLAVVMFFLSMQLMARPFHNRVQDALETAAQGCAAASLYCGWLLRLDISTAAADAISIVIIVLNAGFAAVCAFVFIRELRSAARSALVAAGLLHRGPRKKGGRSDGGVSMSRMHTNPMRRLSKGRTAGDPTRGGTRQRYVDMFDMDAVSAALEDHGKENPVAKPTAGSERQPVAERMPFAVTRPGVGAGRGRRAGRGRGGRR